MSDPEAQRTCGDCRLPIVPACRCEDLVAMGEDGRLIVELGAHVAELDTCISDDLFTMAGDKKTIGKLEARVAELEAANLELADALLRIRCTSGSPAKSEAIAQLHSEMLPGVAGPGGDADD